MRVVTIADYCNWCASGDSGTLEDTELVDGLVFNQKTAGAGGPKRVEKAKIGLIQFCISPPKTDVCFHRWFTNFCGYRKVMVF